LKWLKKVIEFLPDAAIEFPELEEAIKEGRVRRKSQIKRFKTVKLEKEEAIKIKRRLVGNGAGTSPCEPI
jgi:hypothetical protein